MKKIILTALGISILAVIYLTGIFYFQKTKKALLQNEIITASSSQNNVKLASFPVAGDKIKILFVGDMMFDRYIRQVSETHGDDFIFQNINNLLKSEDLVVGNLEGPITDKTSVSVTSQLGDTNNYIFTFPPQTAQDLYNENIKLVNIGNNHILNQGQDGLASTENYLQSANVGFFGDPNQAASSKLYATSGLKIAFVNYNQFIPDGISRALDNIKNARAQGADIIILYAHWGTEFVPEPSQKIKDLAHQFVDAGADLVIGSHPHVIQPKEIYKGKTIYPHTKENIQKTEIVEENSSGYSNNWSSPDFGVRVYYSLGNFIFDQYFSPETQKGAGVLVEIDPATKNINFKDFDFFLQTNGQTVLK